MNMKRAMLVCVAMIAPCAAQSVSSSAPSASVDSENREWRRAEFERQINAHQERVRQTGVTKEEGRVEIYSLKDYPAPQAVKERMAEGIQARRQGVVEVANEAIPSIEAVSVRSPARSNAELKQKLSYAPAQIEKTSIGAAELLSTEPTGTINGDRSTGVVRTYHVPGLGVVVLSEDDYIASGTVITLIQETLNTEVNGSPARSYAVGSKDGRGKAEVRWVTPSRSYWLTLISEDGARIEHGEQVLLKVARSISQQ